ncbi:MAG: family 78 glycoside hydrolase catalytic domain [Salinibacterium sp.]|nr:family 78 glycoside hydrolase catalytic domain [Salinibacterium sp.]
MTQAGVTRSGKGVGVIHAPGLSHDKGSHVMSAGSSAAPSIATAPSDLRVDGRTAGGSAGRLIVEPSGRHPRLSWIVPLLRNGQEQRGWEVRMTPRAGHGAVTTLTGEGADPFTSAAELRERSTHDWSVRVRDEHEVWSEWSEPSMIQTGPFEYGHWNARWVSQPALETRRVVFTLGAAILSAHVRVAAQGLVRVEMNGAPVNADATDPSRTDIVRALYRCYDVTDLVRTGNNEWDITLAGGDWGRDGRDPRVLAELVVVTADGRSLAWSPVDATLAAPSEVVIAEPFYRERHDSTAVRTFMPITTPTEVTAEDHPGSAGLAPTSVRADDTEPIRNVIPLTPMEIGRSAGARVFDVGINIAGRTELVVRSPGATGTIRLVHGEHLDGNGRVDTTSLTLPTDSDRVRQALEFVLTGEAGQICTPWFSYHGFRYVEVEGLDDSVELGVTTWTHHTDLRRTTAVDCDSELIDRLLQRAERTLLNNVHGIPEDCPTREQAGWTGDTASVTEMEFSLFDMQAFFRKWLGDLRTSQLESGAIPAISPRHSDHDTDPDPVWGAALQRVLIGHWHHYGDRAVVDATLPSLRRWADYQLSCRGVDGVISESPISYGHDWLALQQTPPRLHHTNATIDCLEVLAELEDVVGHAGAALLRRAQAVELRQAGLAAFHDPETGAFGNGSQGSLAIGIESGMLTGDVATAALDALARDIHDRGDRVCSGFATTRTVVRALARGGRSDVIMAALGQPSEPGIGAMLDHGPGTFWECWWIDPNNTGTGSLDHVGLGGPFASWALQTLAGVRPTAAGYARFEVAPTFVTGIDRLRLTTTTIRGTVSVAWERRGTRLQTKIEVPVGAEADVVVGGRPPMSFGAGRYEFETDVPETEGRQGVARPEDGAAALSVLGQYRSAAPVAADETGGATWLGAAVRAGAISGTDVVIEVLPDGIACMPIPHEQLSGPVVRVISTDQTGDHAPRVRVELDDAQDLTDAHFVWAMVDLCLENTHRPIELVLQLFAADGTSTSTSGRVWPAGWNRVALDLRDWPGKSAVVAAEVGIAFVGENSTAAQHPPAFQLGELGFSTARRTW